MKLFTNPVSPALHPIQSHCVLCGEEQWREAGASSPLTDATITADSGDHTIVVHEHCLNPPQPKADPDEGKLHFGTCVGYDDTVWVLYTGDMIKGWEPAMIGDGGTFEDSNERWDLKGGSPPHKPSSSGKVIVELVDASGQCDQSYTREFYPSVIDMVWIKMEGLEIKEGKSLDADR